MWIGPVNLEQENPSESVFILQDFISSLAVAMVTSREVPKTQNEKVKEKRDESLEIPRKTNSETREEIHIFNKSTVWKTNGNIDGGGTEYRTSWNSLLRVV